MDWYPFFPPTLAYMTLPVIGYSRFKWFFIFCPFFTFGLTILKWSLNKASFNLYEWNQNSCLRPIVLHTYYVVDSVIGCDSGEKPKAHNLSVDYPN